VLCRRPKQTFPFKIDYPLVIPVHTSMSKKDTIIIDYRYVRYGTLRVEKQIRIKKIIRLERLIHSIQRETTMMIHDSFFLPFSNHGTGKGTDEV
jgi:hypothetical protein